MTQARKRVLVVDDDPQIRRVVGRILAGGGYEAMSAEDGPEGLKMAEVHGPDLVILDVAMPGLDGYGVCAALQKNPRTSHIPVMMLSGLSEADEVVQGLDLGADAYVTKPFNVEELLARVGNLIERSRYFVYTSANRVV